MAEDLLYRLEDGVAWITLNRPETKNAITPDQRNRVITLLEEAGADDETRCVVITGAGGSFCSGADLRATAQAKPEPQATAQAKPEPQTGSGSAPGGSVSQMIKEGAQRLIAAIIDCPKPVIAAVDGVAAGIGAHIAFASDLVIASKSARFIEVFARRALVPDGGGAYLLVRLIGPQRAKELVFFGDAVAAGDALEMGLVNRVVPARELEATVAEWANRLAAGPTRTLSAAKKLINAAHDSDRDEAFDAEALAQEENMKTADAQEGIQSFRERREPRFIGK